MRHFFSGWRRTIGAMALVLAVALMAAWIRSEITYDFMGIRTNGACFRVGSIVGWCELTYYSYSGPSDDSSMVSWTTGKVSEWRTWYGAREPNPQEYRPFVEGLSGRKLKCFVFQFGGCRLENGRDWTYSFAIRYWSIVLPLTLLSAFLLFSKPRVAKPKSGPTQI